VQYSISRDFCVTQIKPMLGSKQSVVLSHYGTTMQNSPERVGYGFWKRNYLTTHRFPNGKQKRPLGENRAAFIKRG
jgi:hypothetical protein